MPSSWFKNSNFLDTKKNDYSIAQFATVFKKFKVLTTVQKIVCKIHGFPMFRILNVRDGTNSKIKMLVGVTHLFMSLSWTIIPVWCEQTFV